MNYNKYIFTVEEFNALPVYTDASAANTGEVFLLVGKMAKQKVFLSSLVLEHTEDGIIKQIERETKANKKVDHRIKVTVWKKFKDGNVGEYGGTIKFTPTTVPLEVKDDKLILNFGDDNLAFKYDDGRIIDEPVVGIAGG
jgi:hypothetical protein